MAALILYSLLTMQEARATQPDEATERWTFGEQSLWVVAPDVIHLRLVGVVDGPELAAIYAKQREWGKDKERWFSLVDLSTFKTSTPSSRAVVLEAEPVPGSTAVLYGLTFATRMLIDLTMRGKRLIRPDSARELVVAASEADAWEKIERLRATPLA